MGPIVVFANGRAMQVAEGTTLADLVQSFELAAGSVLVELNGEVPPRGEWMERRLEHGDRVEVFRVVAGG